MLNNTVNTSLEWMLTSPPKPHTFVSLPLQSKISFNTISFNKIIKFLISGFIMFIIGYSLRILIQYVWNTNVLTQVYHIEYVIYYLSISYLGLGLWEFVLNHTNIVSIVDLLKTLFPPKGGNNWKMTMSGTEDPLSKQTVKKFSVMAKSLSGPEVKLGDEEIEALREAAERAASREAARIAAVLDAANAAGERVRQEALPEIEKLFLEDAATTFAASQAANIAESLPEGPDKDAANIAAKEAKDVSDAKQKEFIDRVNTMYADISNAQREVREANGI